MASKSRAARSKRTKDELISEMEALEQKLSSADVPDPTTAALAKENATKTRETVKGLSVDTIVSKGATFGLEVQRTVAGLTEQAVQKAEELRTLQEAIEVETQELERLYDLDVASASVAALVAEHEVEKARLEKEISVARTAWDEEIRAHNKSIVQRNSETELQRRQEEQQYAYRIAQERTRAKDAFDYSQALAVRGQEEREAAFAKECATRVEALNAKEIELAQFKARVDGLDAEIKKATDTAVAIATNSVKRDLVNQFALERKDLEAALSLEKQKNQAAVDATTKMAQEIEKLHAQLTTAKQQVTDITVKALESASGQQALQNVRDLVKDNGQGPRNGQKS